MKKEMLENLKQNINLMQELVVGESVFAILDTEGRILAYYPNPAVPLPLKEGTIIEDQNNPVYHSMQTDKKLLTKIPRELLGISIEAKFIPIKEDGKVVGAIVNAISTEMQDEIFAQSEALQDDLNNTRQSMQSILEAMDELKSDLQSIQSVSDEVGSQIVEASTVIASVQKNASYSNILALNASIESARAGQAGRGFTVVATEMGKFSKANGESAKKISETLTGIVNSLQQINEKLQKSQSSSTQQSVLIDDIMNKYTQITETSQTLVELSKQQAGTK